MKRRIISSILVVVMLVLSLVSCGYSFQKDNMSQYMTFNKDAFAADLDSLDYADGDFTANEETRKEKIQQYIYKLLTGRAATNAEELKEGAVTDLDKISYRYYATYEKDGETIFVYPSRMASSTLDSIGLGDTTLTGEKKAIREKVLELIKDGKLADVKGFIFTPKTTYTPDSEGKTDAYKEDTAEGVVAYISYTKTWTEGTETKNHEYKYERVTLGADGHFAAEALVNSKIGVKLTDDEANPRKNTENGDDQAVFPAVLDRGNDKTEHRRRKHNACRKGKDDVGKFVRKAFEYESYQRTDYRGAAHTKGSKYNKLHLCLLFM